MTIWPSTYLEKEVLDRWTVGGSDGNEFQLDDYSAKARTDNP